MIRFLQKDTKTVKIMFGVIIGAACVSMVIYLVPGLMDPSGANDTTVYATVREPGVLGRMFGQSTEIKTDEVTQLAQRQLQQQHYPDFLLPYMMDRAGEILVQRTMLTQAADRLHLQVSDEDLRRELRTGPFAQYLFPDGKYIGDDQYMNFVQSAFGTTRSDFESQVKDDMELQRLQAMVTGGATVSDDAVRKAYLVQGLKVQFDYAVASLEDLKKTINPADAELQDYFKQNAAKYAVAIPETRKIEYVAFDAAKLPGGKATVSDAEAQAYYSAHQEQYKTEEQVKTRHILIAVKAGSDAATDAAAKAKAQDVLNQLKAGGNFAELAKKYSEDPGSKDSGGELQMIATASLDPAYAKAAMALNPGQTSGLVKSSFGYHIIQTEQKQAAGVKPLAEVKDTIQKTLEQDKQGAALQSYGTQLAGEARKNGLEKTAAAHGLHVVTTDYVAKDAVIGGLSDGAQMLSQAFAAAKGADPAAVSTGDGYALFTVLDVKAAHAPEFAAYKTHILDDYRDQKAPQMLQAETTKLAARAKELNDLKKAAAELKLPVKTSGLVGQDGQVTDLGAMNGPGAVAFTLAKGGISGPIDAGQTGVVLCVTDKQEPSADDIAKNFDATREQLLSQQREEIFRVYMGTLTDKYDKGGGVRTTKKAASKLPTGN
ncbi:MAG TPA: peptidyl-prolyl cis-trans isomerase [Acidobacteriaceae bacterium]|nr:peptidyl-prolyl cis-trans isomerase [Acidobacteriaceae bacterium]